MQKSSQEDVDREGERARRVRPSVRVLKRDLAIADAFESFIRERDAIDIAREVERRVAAVPNWLNMDRPAALPDAGVDVRDDSSACQRIAHLRSEDAGEGIAGKQESGVCRSNPRRTISRQ